MVTEQAGENRRAIEAIIAQYRTGKISYDEALEQSKPIMTEINKGIAAVAKRNGKKPYKLQFKSLIRM